MPNPPPRTPAECFATILLWLSRTVNSHGMTGRLAVPLVGLILDRVRAIQHRFAQLAAAIAAGTYAPRRPPTPSPRPASPETPKKPRQRNPLPHRFAWLVRLAPETAVYGSQLRFLFADPAMAALLAASPAPLRRPLRSLCWMLGVHPPPILAPPPPARPKPPPERRERPATPKPSRKPSRPRYVFGLRYPPPFPDPA